MSKYLPFLLFLTTAWATVVASCEDKRDVSTGVDISSGPLTVTVGVDESGRPAIDAQVRSTRFQIGPVSVAAAVDVAQRQRASKRYVLVVGVQQVDGHYEATEYEIGEPFRVEPKVPPLFLSAVGDDEGVTILLSAAPGSNVANPTAAPTVPATTAATAPPQPTIPPAPTFPAIAFGQTVSGQISVPNGSAVWSIPMSKGTQISLSVERTDNSRLVPSVELLDPDGNREAFGWGCIQGSTGNSTRSTTKLSGVYTIQIQNSCNSQTGRFELTVTSP